jgi:hypothetical protein
MFGRSKKDTQTLFNKSNSDARNNLESLISIFKEEIINEIISSNKAIAEKQIDSEKLGH